MYKKILLCISISFLLCINHSSANTLIERTISGYKAKIIEYKTDSKVYDIKIGVHPKGGGTLRSIMNTVGGVSGVNGVFECPKDYSSCGGKNYTINERYVKGEKKAKYKSTGDRVVFAWDKETNPFLFQTDTINPGKEGEIWEGFANHPLLLKGGEPQTELYHEKGLIDSKMKAKTTKNFICSDRSGKNIYFGLVYAIDIDTLAVVLKDFGCWNAINLDAGNSTSFIYNGKYVVGPQREILDGVFIVPKNLDTAKIETSAKKISSALLKYISENSNSEKIVKLERILKTLNTLSSNIYSKNTVNIYETKNGEKVKVGTKTEITSSKNLEKLYLINLLRTYTTELISVHEKIRSLEFLKKSEIKIKIEVEL